MRNDYYSDHMVRTMGATEVKAKMLALLEEVAAGEQIEITKHGRVVARLVPARGPRALRGQFSEVAMTAAADDELFSTDTRWELS